MWVDYGNGRTEGTFKGYAEAEPRLHVARKKLYSGEITPWKVKEVIQKIFGMNRINTDWQAAVGELESPVGHNRLDWERDVFEAWLKTKPLLYRKVYHSPGTVLRFVLSEDEVKETEKGKPE